MLLLIGVTHGSRRDGFHITIRIICGIPFFLCWLLFPQKLQACSITVDIPLNAISKYENHHGGYSFMCLDQLRRNEIFSMVWSWNTWVHHVIYPLGLKIFVISTLDSFLRLLGYFWFLFFFLGRTGEGGSTSTSESTRDDAFRSLFSNRLDDFMDSTSSTGDIFPPPLASSRSGQLITHLFKLIHPCGGRHWEWHFITYKTTWAQVCCCEPAFILF